MNEDALADDVLCGNYGINKSICRVSTGLPGGVAEFRGPSLGLDEIPYPNRTVLLVDSGYATISWWNAADQPPGRLGSRLSQATYVPGATINADRYIPPCQQLDALEGRHPGKKVNVAYADGRVARKNADDLAVQKTDDGYENRRPTWTPDGK